MNDTKTSRLGVAVEIVKQRVFGTRKPRNEHLVFVAGIEIAREQTEADARKAAASALEEAITAAHKAPVFTRADDGNLWVSVCRGSDHWDHFRVVGDVARHTGWGKGPTLGEHVNGTTLPQR